MAEPGRTPPWETRSGTRVGVAGLYKDPNAPPTPFLAPRPRSRARHSFSCRTHYQSFSLVPFITKLEISAGTSKWPSHSKLAKWVVYSVLAATQRRCRRLRSSSSNFGTKVYAAPPLPGGMLVILILVSPLPKNSHQTLCFERFRCNFTSARSDFGSRICNPKTAEPLGLKLYRRCGTRPHRLC